MANKRKDTAFPQIYDSLNLVMGFLKKRYCIDSLMPLKVKCTLISVKLKIENTVLKLRKCGI